MRKLIPETQRKQAEQKQKILYGLDQFEKAIGVVKEEKEFKNRTDYPAPPPPEKNRKNPDGIVDIVTFCEHPYFLYLKLTPWQKLILKIFYAGSEGNTHLKINDEYNEIGCEGCVWENNYISESEHFLSLKKNTIDRTVPVKPCWMSVENSTCLKCTRLNSDIKKSRYKEAIEKAISVVEEDDIYELQRAEDKDLFQTELSILEGDLDHNVKEQVLKKVGRKFQELILVLGRRSGKSFMVSVICLYETYKFLMMGHPQKRYPIMPHDTITILNVANAEEQAKNAIFSKILNLVLTSPYFSTYLGKDTQTDLYFLTDADKEENRKRKEDGKTPLVGTINLHSGHSNSSTLVGLTVSVVIIDEMAEMAGNSEDVGADDDLYGKLKPSIATFGMDGKIICISNPLGPSGKFYSLYKSSFTDQTTLMFQLPTWLSNPNISKAFLHSEKLKDPKKFMIYYGAKFNVAGEDPFLPEEAIDACFERGSGRRRSEFSTPLTFYFAHLDPAKNSDNYALAVVHTEPYGNIMDEFGVMKQKVVVDHIHLWRSTTKNQPVNPEEVDEYMINLSTKFKFAQISYDHWNSMSSIAKLQNRGLNVLCTTFNQHYQDMIFDNLWELFIDNRIDIYDIDTKIDNGKEYINLEEISEAKIQFKNLQKKWKGNRYKIEALAGYHDDIVDCVASAAYQALKVKIQTKLPRTRTMQLGPYIR